jgi:hypothetical protein
MASEKSMTATDKNPKEMNFAVDDALEKKTRTTIDNTRTTSAAKPSGDFAAHLIILGALPIKCFITIKVPSSPASTPRFSGGVPAPAAATG